MLPLQTVQLGLSDALVGFIASLLVGTVATYLATEVLLGEGSLGHSFVTALIASAVWVGATYLISGYVGVSGYVVALGPLLGLLAYIVVIDLRYSGSIVTATGVSILTWVIDFALLYALAALGFQAFEIVGVPPGI
ncbi:hypothetical protein [Halomarina litorea]|uniref:hypothetical protein n=1 Tax=Halomarina litorea TaxID=2961595 RepID=UPI0020C3CA6C|nr:hypothetical protein [Halomarina sp. BCD28]